MTRDEFTAGWRLLIIQPWGWRYNQTEADGRPTFAARAQLEFYYDRLRWADARAWLEVARTYAQGDEWPSLNALSGSLRQVQTHYVKAVADRRVGEEMPDGVRDILSSISGTMTMEPHGRRAS